MAQINLTNDTRYDTKPVWSPDSQMIAYESQLVTVLPPEIYIVSADGTWKIPLVNAPSRSPEWSPDGTKIAYVSGRTGNAEIYSSNANGSNQTNLTNRPEDDYSPSWRLQP